MGKGRAVRPEARSSGKLRDIQCLGKRTVSTTDEWKGTAHIMRQVGAVLEVEEDCWDPPEQGGI